MTGLNQVNINSFEDLMGALNFGSSIRQTDATAINAKSSRSHAVFSLNLVQRKSPGSMMSPKEKRHSMPVESLSSSDAVVTVDSKLHFVDLAGSERLKNTGASGERAKEGISINAGLASLGKVISQLSSRQPGAHVSYRDSKLTRLLQDSLGGNAITYMVACVTPAEFHLSETLNTVQYAQRARAIQSKPRIQQVTDESDKQAVIDRLKAEIAFLRQQIRNAEAGERKSAAPQERGDRPTDRELELQNHLLDMQESYNALSQRHAKLISEITKASELNSEDPDELAAAIGNSSVERLKRSHSFAESVEQVVLEYEKTIQSLESSLSSTRASLANTESALLERETKCAYIETMNAQLQARVQKMMDREASTEKYLHDLEAKLDGHTSGEEKNAAIIAELRKELARARENESNCEDYISTLEERLAEADQDMELMQREINRLEHVIDRQRSLGKLDNLLYELDHIQQNGVKSEKKEDQPVSEPAPNKDIKTPRARGMSLDILAEAAETAIPEDDDRDLGENPPAVDGDKHDADAGASKEASKEQDHLETSAATARDLEQSPAQSKFVAEKLESVTQELLDLRMQHEQTQTEYELLAAKYEEALRTLAELQDAVDESRHPPPSLSAGTPASSSRPTSFLEDTKDQEAKGGEQRSSSRSLSSELSLVEQSGTSQEASDANGVKKEPVESHEASESASQEIENLRKLLQEHEEGMNLVAQKYAQLQAEHEETLGLVEELKKEIQRSKPVPSPTSPTPVIRRMTSQSLMSGLDRAHRSLAALRNIAVEEFEDRPETLQNFEHNLNTAMHELHTRMERIQALEAENASVRKEMETKATIISGLTRERSSLQGAKPMDMGLVSQLQDQILQQENQIKEMQEAHGKREQELRAEIESLNQALASKEAPATTDTTETSREREIKIEQLEAELSDWKGKHQTAIESLETSEKQLHETKAELEAALASVDTLRSEQAAAANAFAEEKAAAARDLENERAKHQAIVDSLQQDIEEHKSTIARHLETIAGLEASHAAAQEQLAQLASTQATNDADSAAYASRISELERELEEHKALVEEHKALVDSQKADLVSLKESHRRELEELESKAAAAAQAEQESRLAEQNAKHEEAMLALRSEISNSKDEVSKLLDTVSNVLKTEVTPVTLADQLEDIVSEKQNLASKYAELVDANEELLKQLELKGGLDGQVKELTDKAAQQEAKVNELAHLVANLEENLRQKEELIKKKDATIEEITAEKQKSVRLVEELEEQITTTFDQHNNRLSVIQQERAQQLEEANTKISNLEKEIETYRVRIEQLEVSLHSQTLISSCVANAHCSFNSRTAEPKTRPWIVRAL